MFQEHKLFSYVGCYVEGGGKHEMQASAGGNCQRGFHILLQINLFSSCAKKGSHRFYLLSKASITTQFYETSRRINSNSNACTSLTEKLLSADSAAVLA